MRRSDDLRHPRGLITCLQRRTRQLNKKVQPDSFHLDRVDSPTR